MGIYFPVMPKQAPTQPTPKRGRPATGKTKVKLSASITPDLIEAAQKAAFRNGESLSSFVARAISNLAAVS